MSITTLAPSRHRAPEEFSNQSGRILTRWLGTACAAAFFPCGLAAAVDRAPAAREENSFVVFVGAGDIAGAGSEDEDTARLLDQVVSAHSDAVVFTLGDNAYPDGSAANYGEYFDPTWGRHKDRIRPIPGNHDYRTPGAKAYFEYFGTSAGEVGKGYYSYKLGTWHIVALNSEIDMSAGSAQEQWLRTDLDRNPSECILAYMHQPPFSSGNEYGGSEETHALWRALYEYGADVVLAGHEHNYERFAPQNHKGEMDPVFGIRQFIIGTGGISLYRLDDPADHSMYRNDSAYGVGKFLLKDGSYEWELMLTAGYSIDRGDGECSSALPPPLPTALDLRLSASSDDAEEAIDDGDTNLTSTGLDLVSENNTAQLVGLRFRDVRIPQGANIVDAYVQFTARDDANSPTFLMIKGHAADDSLAFQASKKAISERPRTTASTWWDPEEWRSDDANPAQRSPTLASIIQEIVDRPGWREGNAFSLIISGSGVRVAKSYDGHSSEAPLLHVEYQAAP